MIHQKFDIERWKSLFPLQKIRKEAREFVEGRRDEMPDQYKSESDVERHVKLMNPSGEIITSPYHLAVVEQLRDEGLGGRSLPTFPTDTFVFARGEPKDRCVTKIGGLPFWPKSREWPIGSSGKPMTFLAQFCFADSTDIFDSLPGEILLIFADGVYGSDWQEEDAKALHFEWIDRSQSNLIDAGEMPSTRWDLFPVYGEIHRTRDYLVGYAWETTWWPTLLKESKNPREFLSGLGAKRALEESYHQPWCISVIEGTKIAGIPRWIQSAEEIPGRFLCALGSVHPVYQTIRHDSRCLYPFTNFQGPLVRGRRVFQAAGEEIEANRLLMWSDVGSLFLFVDGEGSIHWTIQSY